VMVGLGGIFVEILADVAFRICPITPRDAEEMLGELKGAPLLDGARGRKPVSRAAMIEVLLKIGGEGGLLMRHERDIAEADINPLIVSAEGAVAVDARFVLTQPPMNADERR
jgi:acetate---CoA ligase (ADP-forming) subunit beta